jgi:transcriptional regulator with XRE-family HTH domain
MAIGEKQPVNRTAEHAEKSLIHNTSSFSSSGVTMPFGKFLKEMRILRGHERWTPQMKDEPKAITQEELGFDVGTVQKVISAYERGITRPSGRRLSALAEILRFTFFDDAVLLTATSDNFVIPGTLSERVKQERYKRGLSQKGFAKAMGISRQTISMIENGNYRPVKKIHTLANALQISQAELQTLK